MVIVVAVVDGYCGSAAAVVEIDVMCVIVRLAMDFETLDLFVAVVEFVDY